MKTKINCTDWIAKEAMRIVSKDVRLPKCVRDGVVKKSVKKMRKVHLKGAYISSYEKEQNTYLLKYQAHHTVCGYLLYDTPEDNKRVSWDKEKITCKRCINELKKQK